MTERPIFGYHSAKGRIGTKGVPNRGEFQTMNTRFPFSRRLLFVQGLAFLAGCRSIADLPTLLLDRDETDDDHLLNVGGEVAEIRTTHDWRFMAVRARTRRDADVTTDGEGASRLGTNLTLYNIEFQHPLPCPNYGLDLFENPTALAFGPKSDSCYVVSGFSAYGPNAGRVAVDRVILSPPKKGDPQPFHLEDPDWNDALLSPAADWLAVQTKEGVWSFRDLTADPVKEVCFPETYRPKSEDRQTAVSRVLAISPDGTLAAALMAPTPDSGDERNQTIAIWDLSTARSIPIDKAKKLPLEALFVSEFQIRDNAAGRICAFSPDGRMLAVRNKQKYVGIWQTAGGKILAEFGEHRQPVTALQFTPNNAKLVVGTGGNFGRLLVWDVRKGKLLRTYNDPAKESRKITAIQVSPDGNLVYFGNDRGNVNQWEYQATSEATKG